MAKWYLETSLVKFLTYIVVQKNMKMCVISFVLLKMFTQSICVSRFNGQENKVYGHCYDLKSRSLCTLI